MELGLWLWGVNNLFNNGAYFGNFHGAEEIVNNLLINWPDLGIFHGGEEILT